MTWKSLQIQLGRPGRAVLVNAFRAMAYNESPATAAAIAYFSLFSIFPLLLLIITVCNNYFNLFDASSTAVRAVLRFFPGAESFIRKNIASVHPSREIIISSAIVFIWTSFWLVALLENALDKAWQVKTPRHFLHSRLLALLMISVGGSFLGASVVLTTILTIIQQKIHQYTFAHWATAAGLFWRTTFGLTAFLLTLLVFTLVYKLVPNIDVQLSEALTAGIVAGTLWQIAAYVFAVLVRHLDYDAIYGPVGAIVALLSWVYLSSYLFLFGAHLAAQMHRILPDDEIEGVPAHPVPLGHPQSQRSKG